MGERFFVPLIRKRDYKYNDKRDFYPEQYRYEPLRQEGGHRGRWLYGP